MANRIPRCHMVESQSKNGGVNCKWALTASGSLLNIGQNHIAMLWPESYLSSRNRRIAHGAIGFEVVLTCLFYPYVCAYVHAVARPETITKVGIAPTCYLYTHGHPTTHTICIQPACLIEHYLRRNPYQYANMSWVAIIPFRHTSGMTQLLVDNTERATW